MEQEYLRQLKEKLGELTFEESLMRDLYLQGLATGEIQGPPVGYSSIDKPWLNFYSKETLMKSAPETTIYEHLYNNNKDHPNDIAIEYYGKKITYKELFENIIKTAQSYKAMGVKKGDIVTLCTITTPEIIYSFYALNMLGAISNMVDVRYTKQAIEEYLKEVNSKFLVTLDLCYPKIKDIIENTNVEKVITVSPVNSTPTIIKAVSKMSDYFKGNTPKIPFGEKYIDWNTFIENRINEEIIPEPYIKDFPAAIVHTGGTTGIPKGVVLTNDNFNNATIQISSVVNERGYKFLNIMPPFVSYGLVLGVNAPITLGWDTVVIPKFDAKKFDDLILKYKPNGIMGVPTYWENIMNSPKIKNQDLSYLKNILLGGDRIFPDFEIRLNEFLKAHNFSGEVSKGYSMTEASALTSFSTSKANELDSVGAPMPKTIVSIFEPGTTKELMPGEVGEVCIKTPTMMKEYYNKEEDTSKVKVLHEDGYWLHSGDLGYMDKNGILFIKDRIKRMFPRSGWKVFPSELEKLYMTNPAVEYCAVVGIPDEVDITAPKAHVVLKNEYKGKEEIIKQQLDEMFENSSLPPYFKPIDIKFRDELPLTDLGKIDFISLIEEEKSIKQTK